MSHYEERLERDLLDIREQVAEMAALVETAAKNALHALQTGNSKLASATVIEDHVINRRMRQIDLLCHKFIALHLPSAGPLRMLSSVIRANIELERIGDYAVTIARESLQMASPPSGPMARELERLGSETLLMLSQSIKAFNELNPDMAKGTMLLEEQMEHDLDIIYSELMANDDRDMVKSMLAMFAVFTQLKRVADQAKNLCEETVFAVTGDTKAPKIYNILFVDEDNSCQSQVAEAIARKNFPESGRFISAGRQPAAELNPVMVEFLDGHGVNLAVTAKPSAIDMTPLEWYVGPAPESGDEAGIQRMVELYRNLAVQIRDLMEIMRGEGAP